jgi:tetratricopeptide (TPR) repeat protein
MENQKASENPAPNTSTDTDGDDMTAEFPKESSQVDYKLMAKVIDKQLAKQNRNYAKELQKKFKKFISDNQVNFDRLSKENRRLLKIVEDLQSSQRHLQHQLELHQEREKLAVLREQQDVKRIKDLEDRLSLFLLAPTEKNRITYEESEQSEIDIQQAEIIEIIDEPSVDTALESNAGDEGVAGDQEQADGQVYFQDPLETPTDIEELKTATLEEIEPITQDQPSFGTVIDEEGSTPDKNEIYLDNDSEDIEEMYQYVDGDSQEQQPEDESRDFVQKQKDPTDVIELEVEAESITDEPFLAEEDPIRSSESAELEQIGIDGDNEPTLGEALVDQDSIEDNQASEKEIDLTETQTVGDKIIAEDSSSIVNRIEQDDYRPTELPRIAITTSDYISLHRRDIEGPLEEPSTEEIETVGEMPPLDLDSPSSSFQGSETASDPDDDSFGTTNDALIYEPADKPDSDLESLPIDSVAGTEKTEVGILEDETSQDEIIELQDEIGTESHSEDIDSAETPPDAISSDVSIEIPGMQLESVGEERVDIAPQIQTNENLVDEILDSEEEADTGSFEIIELQEENIVSSALDTKDDLNLKENEPSSYINPEVSSREVSDSPAIDTLDEKADVDLSTGNAESFFKRGKSACETKNWAEAAKYFNRFVELEPDEPRGHYNLAILYYRLKDYPAAKTHAERALTLEYTPAKKIMRKIEFRLANESKIDDRSDHLIEDSNTDEPIMLNEVVTSDSSALVDDETLVYEPDILPNFNIDLADNQPADETEDEPIDLLTPIGQQLSDADASELELSGEAADLDSFLESDSPIENSGAEQDIEQPGMENVDEVIPGELSPTDAPISSGIESHVSLLETKEQGNIEIADEQPGMALEGDPIVADDRGRSGIKSGDSENDPMPENLAFDPSQIIETQPQDKPETSDDAGQMRQAEASGGLSDNDFINIVEEGDQQQDPGDSRTTAKESYLELKEEENDISISSAIGTATEAGPELPQKETQPPPDSKKSVIEPTRVDEQQENLFEEQIVSPGFDDMVQVGSIEKSDTVNAEYLQDAESAATSGENMVESTEERPTANKCFTMAIEASQKKDYPEAIACFERYVEQRPDEPKGYYNLAILHYRTRDYDKASESANRALQLGAKSSQKIIDKIESKRSQVNSDKPADANKDVLSNLLNDSLNFPTTDLDNPAMDDETASIWDADELDGDINQSLISDGAADSPLGSKDDVIVFDSLMEPENNNSQPEEISLDSKPSVEELKITALHRKPQHDSKAMALNSDDSIGVDDSGATSPSENGRVQNLFTLGEKAIENNEFLKAIKHFTKVTHLAPEDPRGYYYLALVSCRLKFFETAREHATRAIEMGSEPAKKVLEEINTLQTPA